MGLKHLMTLCLSKLSNLLRPSIPSEVVEAVPGLPHALSSDEFVARFIFNDRELFASGHAKPKAFMPEKGAGVWETSVCRKTETSEDRIWEIARTVRFPKVALARADVCMLNVHQCGLLANAAPEPNYAEHSVIVDWPQGDDEKAHHKVLATLLASESNVFAIPA